MPKYCTELKMKVVKAYFNGETNINEINYLTYRLISTWVGLIPSVLKNKKKVKILVASLTNFHHSINMKDYLEIMLSDFIEVELYNNLIFNIDKIDNEIYDFVFTDFTIKLNNGPKWRYFYGNQGYRDIMKISDDIYKKFFEKNAYL